MSRRSSKWTHIYWAFKDGAMKPCVRLVTVETPEARHGIQVSGYLNSKEDAIKMANFIDNYMDSVEDLIIQHYLRQQGLALKNRNRHKPCFPRRNKGKP